MDNFFSARRIRAAAKTKTCAKCGLNKPLSEFSAKNKRCKVCQANYYVTCGGCKIKKLEDKMKIYDKYPDRYFCNERCRNRFYGIKRDLAGYIISFVIIVLAIYWIASLIIWDLETKGM